MNALSTFRTPPFLHNCAQAIAYRWQRLYPQGAAIVEAYAPYKGGLAPGGMCGALYAAMQARPAHAESIRAAFLEKVGACRCIDIKTQAKTPCQACVATADALLEAIEEE